MRALGLGQVLVSRTAHIVSRIGTSHSLTCSEVSVYDMDVQTSPRIWRTDTVIEAGMEVWHTL